MQSLGYGTELFSLADAPYALLRDLIAQHTGVLFDESKRGLMADKLSELVTANGLTSFLDYYYLLRYDDQADAHWSALMNRLAVPETFFWRQPDQVHALANVVAPAHFTNHPRRPLRIWSAACCTGEEPVSIAIALAEAGLLNKYPIEILATDGSAAMVERARNGLYGDRSFRQLPEALKARYFQPDGDRWRPIERVHRGIHWGVVNLARAAEMEPFATADVIFCRNVFIYFSDDAIRRTVRVFSEHMPHDGYLFLGASESLTRLNVDLELAEIGNAFAYVKEGRRQIAEQARTSAFQATVARDAAP
ncbi:MAG: methyltransferase, CheR-type, SAM-binding domain, C-terminal [Gemmatimonadetes bacterium]|nr:methyltransferase, CheR-type, SAM-binding domain, C-terminal [Gemmatimonadota bacterium]